MQLTIKSLILPCFLLLQSISLAINPKIIGFLETRQNPTLINEYNCIGLYQIKASTLKSIGYEGTIDDFRMNVLIQHIYMNKLIQIHTKIITSDTAYILPLEDNLVLSHVGGIGKAKLINKVFKLIRFTFMNITLEYLINTKPYKYKTELKYLERYNLYKQFNKWY